MRSNHLRAAVMALALIILSVAGAQSARASTTAFDPVPGGTPGALLSPADGQMWVGVRTPDGLRIDRYANGAMTSTTYPGVPYGTLSGTTTDDVWLSTGSALWHFNGTTWSQVDLPSGPHGETMGTTAMDDVAGPEFYVMFDYFSTEGDGFAKTLGRWNGTSWTLLGEPSGDYIFDTISKLKATDQGVVLLAGGYRGTNEYLLSYVNGAWKTPVEVGNYFCCTVNKWVYDWVVQSPTSIWLYGEDTNEQSSKALCEHFDGTGIDDSPCVTGRNAYILRAVELPDGGHLVANGLFDLLEQPDKSTPVPAPGAQFVDDLAVEMGSGVVWASVRTENGPVLMRYGVSSDAAQFVVTARLARNHVEKGDVATVSGTIDPIPGSAADRTVILEVNRKGVWKQVTSTRASALGAYRFNVQQPSAGSFEYRVRKPAVGTTKQGVSTTLSLTVRQPFVVTVLAASKVTKSKKLTVTGKVTPKLAAAGSGVTLQIKSGGQWRDLVDETTSATGTYRIQVIFKVLGTKKLRVMKEAASGLSERTSRTFSVRVVR